jgi:hypothetical protein
MRQGADINADSCSYGKVGPIDVNGELFRISWLRQAPRPGWYLARCTAEGKPTFEDGWLWLGVDRCQPDDKNAKPFARSELADDALWGGREFNPRRVSEKP